MKLKIKTLDHRDFSIEFNDKKTVWELKKHICRLRGVWLHPDTQRLLYAGQVLDNYKQVRSYCIDERKFLLMLPERTPTYPIKRESSPTSLKSSPSSTSSASASSSSSTSHKVAKIRVQPMYIPTESVREQIMGMGHWTEPEVRRALLISLNNPSRAIEYLTSEKPPFPKMVTPPPSRLFLTASSETIKNGISKPESPIMSTLSNSETDIDIKSTSSKESSKSQKILKSRGNLKSQQASLKKSKNTTAKYKKFEKDIQRLVDIGLPFAIATEVYQASCGDVEMAGALLFEQYVDELDRKRAEYLI